MNSPTRRCSSLFALALVAVSFWRPASAANTEICVSTNAQLASALDEAQYLPVTIKIVQGTYDLKNTVWHHFNGGFPGIRNGSQVLGGYTAACAGRDVATGNTKLIDSSGLDAHADASGDLSIEGMTFSVAGGFFVIGGRPENGPIRPDATLLLSRNTFVNQSQGGVFWYAAQNGNGHIRIVDSLATGDTLIANACSLAIQVAGGNAEVDLINNTVVGNSNGYGICILNSYIDGSLETYYGTPHLYAYNNILHGSSAGDLNSTGFDDVLFNNVVGNNAGNPPGFQTGTLTGDPKLNASFHPIEAPPSPVINSGYNSVAGGLPSVDLTGNPRLVGARVDRGAYESSLDFSFTQVVTNIADSGAGSLRAAILNVNGNGNGKITFDIGAGCGPRVITLATELPALNVDATINGFSQTGASANTLTVGDDATQCVILEAGNSNVTRGLVVPANAADGISATIKGLAFSGFSTAAIDLLGGSTHNVDGNHFGGSVGGHALNANGIDIRLGAATHDSTIGGSDAADRNIVGDATGSGILVQNGSADNQILGNYVGVGWGTGYTDRGNAARGIFVLGNDTTISGNLIGNNAQAGIALDGGGAFDNRILGNFIGADADGVALGNGGSGVRFSGSGGDAPGSNTVILNTIAHNGAQGVMVDIGQRNLIRANYIYANTQLGIDLATVGVTANDDDGGAQTLSYANAGQNFPLLTSAMGGYSGGRVTGTLTTLPGTYVVDFYNGPTCDSSGNGEGKVWLGGTNVTVTAGQIGNQGTVSFNIPADAPSSDALLLDGSKITATATSASGNTSEFSACATYSADGIFASGFE